MKTFRFRHPGFRDAPAEVPVPELSDLTDRDLLRLVYDARRRLMIRDTFTAVEGLYWSTTVSQAVWGVLHSTAVEESHLRAMIEHERLGFVFTGYAPARRGPGDLDLAQRLLTGRKGVVPKSVGLGSFLRTVAGASDTRPARRDEVAES